MMKCFAVLSACLVAMLGTGSAVAQTSIDETSEKAAAAPVALVYVARPTHIDGFAASSSGKLTAVPGSPFANIAVSHLSATKKYLFGSGDDGTNIYTFQIASNGSLKQVAVTDPHKYDPETCSGVGPIQIDKAGATLYNYDSNCDSGNAYIQSFRIESNGELQFLANAEEETGLGTLSQLNVLGNDHYAYQIGAQATVFAGYQRESNGALVAANFTWEHPLTKKDGTFYQNEGRLAGDPTDHLAASFLEVVDGSTVAPSVLATFTADSEGNLDTQSTVDNMPATDLAYVSTLSISPSGKLLAVGEHQQPIGTGQREGPGGFQVFHFNGANPIKHYTGLLQKEFIQEFGWDKENHLYALSGDKLYVYTATSSSVKEASGSPYSIPEAASVIVLSLQ
jgi:hypothetical protein